MSVESVNLINTLVRRDADAGRSFTSYRKHRRPWRISVYGC